MVTKTVITDDALRRFEKLNPGVVSYQDLDTEIVRTEGNIQITYIHDDKVYCLSKEQYAMIETFIGLVIKGEIL